MRAFLGILITGFSIQALAADDVLVSQSLDQVRASRMELQEVQRQLPPHLQQAVQQIQQRLDYVDRSLADALRIPGRPQPPPPPPTRPPNYGGRVELEALCELDDDAQFDPGQNQAGVLRGSDVRELIEKCRVLASTRGRNYTSGITNIKVLNKPAHFVQATCDVDDDAQFDYGQRTVGVIAGEDFVSIAHQCREVAKGAHPNGAGGIKNPVLGNNQGRRITTATCHMDDDLQFDEGQIVFGRIQGRDIVDVAQQCQEIARLAFGQNGSSGLKDVREE
ncbi:hypothetical protein [Bdellovibrio sp. HCB337]|uniref:hypothetical protein n=1 Tax=Bdellovibrio sp. HCB337 TaxID=3394358 RepID=UPI0039A680F1